jgi:hypothetical protein
MKLVLLALLSAQLPSVILLLRQRRVAASYDLGTGLDTTVNYVRRKASGAAGNGLGTTVKYLRRTRNGAAGNGLGTTIKYLCQTAIAGNRLATTTSTGVLPWASAWAPQPSTVPSV